MNDTARAQDPEERFDVVTANGAPTGVVLPRRQVHAEGHWHRAVHLWMYGVDEEPYLLFQRRSAEKDTWPGRLDATVGGHYRSGESLVETLREAKEEIGIDVTLAELRPIGTRVHVNEDEPGILDRELQDVFLWRNDRSLETFEPNPAELAAVVQLPLVGLIDLLARRRLSLPGAQLTSEGSTITPTLVKVDDFIPGIDQYPYRVAIAVSNLLAGSTDVAI